MTAKGLNGPWYILLSNFCPAILFKSSINSVFKLTVLLKKDLIICFLLKVIPLYLSIAPCLQQYFSYNELYFFNLILFILFLDALGLHCCMRAFSSCGERGLLFVAMHSLLIVVASLVAEHGL